MKKQVEMSIQDENGNEFVAYPKTHKEHVQFENGMNIDEFVGQDIATPTITHDTTAIKVGVGDSDVSSSVVDSTVNMTIKGQTYQNILPEPTLRNEMQGKSIQRLNEGYDSIETVDGVSKSAILYGRTSFDVLNYKFLTGKYLNINDGTFIDGNSTHRYIEDYFAIPEGTQVITLKGDNNYKKICYYDNNKQFIIGYQLQTQSLDDFTTDVPTGASYFRFNMSMTNPSGSTISVNEYLHVYLDGFLCLTNKQSYTEGARLISCKMPVLTTTGKNLVDLSTSIYGEGYNNVQTDFIKINPNKTFIASMNNQYGSTVTFYTQNKEPIITINGFKVTSPSNAYYLRWVISTQDKTADWNSFQIEEGAVATSYEPYKSNTLSCQLAPLNQTMFEQGTFAETTPPNTQSYEQIKLGSEHLYTTRIRTKGTYKVVKGATYEVQLNDGYGIYVCYCKNGLYSATVNHWLDGTSTFTVPNDCDEMFFAIRKTDNTAIAPSDYPLIGLKIHQEVVLRSLPNGIKDTLNLNTGEYVQRIGEVVVDGSNDERWFLNQNLGDGTYHQYASVNNLVNAKKVLQQTVVSDKLMSTPNESSNNCIWIYDGGTVVIHSSLATANELKTWLSQNPITIQYELATPVVKTVDLSSHGNWEKVVLNGSENWESRTGGTKYSYTITNIFDSEGANGFCDTFKFIARGSSNNQQEECVTSANTNNSLSLFTNNESLSSVGKLKTYLQSNPITVWYQTTTTQDNSIREMLSFANGHLQVSSEAENSLLPSVQYEIPTKNSYHMDLMKPNTKYTIKASTASGKYTLGGIEYHLVGNGTIVTESNTDKFLVITQGSATDLMFLEGDLKNKNIPYFKGIKSAFEGEDKIEVLSTGKNLLDPSKFCGDERWLTLNNDQTISISQTASGAWYYLYKDLKIPTNTYITLEVLEGTYEGGNVGLFRNGELLKELWWGDGGKKVHTYNQVYDELKIWSIRGNCKVRISITETEADYEPYKSNATKIPLLSPLRSLPNGVCDELIIDRLNHKAKLIQRVWEQIYDGTNGQWLVEFQDNPIFNVYDERSAGKNKYGDNALVCNSFLPKGPNNKFNTETYVLTPTGRNHLKFWTDTTLTMNQWQKWLSKNPVVVYYQLEAPIITEIDLEGYPYAYKDGHIFFNSDIAPTTQITYSINQAQQIESANENLQRHEKEISHLQKLIAQYIQVEYESTLLSLKI